jgi:hypothetical protein
MPVITVVGKRFQISSDFMPFLALVGFVTHSMYFIIFGAIFLISKPGGCPTKVRFRPAAQHVNKLLRQFA